MDYNDDGKIDVVAGNEDGTIWFFPNEGSTDKPQLAQGTMIEAEGKQIRGERVTYEEVNGQFKPKVTTEASSELAHLYSKIEVADYDSDGLIDILVGHDKGEFVLYRNKGKKGAPVFDKPESIKPEEGEFPYRPSPNLVDWNNDGKLDLLVGSEDGRLLFYPNTGTKEKPCYVSGTPLKANGEVIKKGTRIRMELVDWNNDGKLDILAGNFVMERNPETRKVTKGGNLWLFLQE